MTGDRRFDERQWHTTILPIVMAILVVLASASSARAEEEADLALRFFSQGGAYCTRMAPEGTNLSEETVWTVVLFTGTANTKNVVRIRSVDPGPVAMRQDALTTVGLTVTSVWRRDRVRDEFFERFARGIESGQLRARLVKIAPGNLAAMRDRERAETYLKFADRGSRVDFDHASDLTAAEFLTLRTYVPD